MSRFRTALGALLGSLVPWRVKGEPKSGWTTYWLPYATITETVHYPRPLTPEEKMRLYNAGRGLVYPFTGVPRIKVEWDKAESEA